MAHECRCGEVDASDIGGARHSAYPMVEVRAATQIVIDAVNKLDNTSAQKHSFLPLLECRGHIAAQTRHATDPFPPFPASTMVSLHTIVDTDRSVDIRSRSQSSLCPLCRCSVRRMDTQ